MLCVVAAFLRWCGVCAGHDHEWREGVFKVSSIRLSRRVGLLGTWICQVSHLKNHSVVFWICFKPWLEISFLSVSGRHLAGEVAKEWQEVEENDKTQQETLLKLVKEIVPYNMAHNAEHEACDLLMEIERLDMLEDYIDENAYGKVCLYLTRFVQVHTFESENTELTLCVGYLCFIVSKKKI